MGPGGEGGGPQRARRLSLWAGGQVPGLLAKTLQRCTCVSGTKVTLPALFTAQGVVSKDQSRLPAGLASPPHPSSSIYELGGGEEGEGEPLPHL